MVLLFLFKRRSFILFCISLIATTAIASMPATAFFPNDSTANQVVVSSSYQPQSPEERAVFDTFMSYVRTKSPASTLTITKLGVVQGFALVYWSLPVDDSGGNALLFLENGGWKLKTSGAGALGAAGLQTYGVPIDVAGQLLDRLDPTWRNPQPSDP